MKPTKCKPKAVRNRAFLTELYHKIAVSNERVLFIPIRFSFTRLEQRTETFLFQDIGPSCP